MLFRQLHWHLWQAWKDVASSANGREQFIFGAKEQKHTAGVLAVGRSPIRGVDNDDLNCGTDEVG